MIPYTHFQFCPNCGGRKIESFKKNGLKCLDCAYVYFHNCASAAAGIIETKEGVILMKRRLAPKRGYFDLPGGFVGYGESLEVALVREMKEELHIDIAALRYFGSFPNTYLYRKVTYFTTDAFFICKPFHLGAMRLSEEICEVAIFKPEKIDLAKIAFRSVKEALQKYQSEWVRKKLKKVENRPRISFGRPRGRLPR